MRLVLSLCDRRFELDLNSLVELLRTNDLVIISFVESLLKDQEIHTLVLDQHMSMLEGSIGILQKRIMVTADQLTQARRVMIDAGLKAQLKPLN